MALRKATKQKAKLRIGLAGPSGAGKTYSALLMASGMTSWDKIALIDTENGSGDLYASLGEYNVWPLKAPFTPEKYRQAITACENEGIEVIIIDSVTHEWDGEGGIKEVHDKMPGNSFTNWAKVNPRHNAFIQAILKSTCHIITTVRSKQGYDMSTNEGKTTVTKVGLREVQREGFEYELTANLNIDVAHMASASKDRTGLFVERDPFVVSSKTGKELMKWCQEGADPIAIEDDKPAPAASPTPATKTVDTVSPEEVSNPHLLSLQKELKNQGATTKAEALALLNKMLPGNYDSISMNETDAKTTLIMLLMASAKKKADKEGADALFGDSKPKKETPIKKFLDKKVASKKKKAVKKS